jgi:hypothetical protein
MLKKYPRTTHLPWSPGVSKDDKVIKSTYNFVGKRVIITEKLDGENSGITYGSIHARSLDSKDHPSRHWLKNTYGYLTYILDPNMKIFGENVFAEHSIHYKNLLSYFYAFSVIYKSTVLSWDDTVSELNKLQMVHVPVIYDGLWDNIIFKNIKVGSTEKGEMEGYVVRLANSFDVDDFSKSIAKYVRAGHVQTDEHWLYKPMVKNELIEI